MDIMDRMDAMDLTFNGRMDRHKKMSPAARATITRLLLFCKRLF
jgi:hypothetical protein